MYINGIEYISNQLDKEYIKYKRYNNSLVNIDNIEMVQEISDYFQNMD